MASERRPESPWTVSYDHYDPDTERRREVVLALGNGVYVTRSTPVDARPGPTHYPGTYRAGCYERIPGRVADTEDPTDSLANLPNWTRLDFRIDGGPWFSLDAVEILDYAHWLDLKAGIATRSVLFLDAAGRRTRLCEERLVSMADPALCALRVALTPQDWSGRIELRSTIDAEVRNTNVQRYIDYEQRHLRDPVWHRLSGNEGMVLSGTLHSGVDIAMAFRTVIDRDDALADATAQDGGIEHRAELAVQPGHGVAIEKHVAICTSLDPEADEAGRRAAAALVRARGFAPMHADHEQAWNRIWQRMGIEAEDPELARFLYLHAFHVMQTVSPLSAPLDVGIPARGWHGEGYRGHIFWDELFVLPFLNFRFPELAREALMYRHRRLDAARDAARKAGWRGAMYPWRSARDGGEVTPRRQKNLLSGAWMEDHTWRQHHIGAAIAFNTWQYYLVTGDREFLLQCGADMMLEIARFWASIASPGGEDNSYDITGVVGPDEYHNAYPGRSEAGLDNNAYTNLMAAWTLVHALRMLDHLESAERTALLERLGIDEEELRHWDHVSRNLRVRFLDDGVIAQFEGFERLKPFSKDVLPPELEDKRLDWALHKIGQSADDYQLSKQADTLTLFYLIPYHEAAELLQRLGCEFDRDRLMRTVEYYLDRTTHRSSLSATVYAGALAGEDLDRSWEFYRQALHTDLEGRKGESIAEGVHLAAMGGTLDVLQRRYLGVRPTEFGLCIEPNLPRQLGVVRLGIWFRGAHLELESRGDRVCVRASAGNAAAVPVMRDGVQVMLEPGGEMEFEAVSPALDGESGRAAQG
ncbi:MAG TPA: glycoside hydrolase family 65 protein [Noviherbaspirillum sp.]|nr:glycoside hydrolase family 65 protein [Noviherbaspirillum sp.]